jgi:hypothetical protein
MMEYKASNWLGLGAGVGVSYYLFGLPSTAMSLSEMAQWYLMVGAVVTAADYVFPDAHSAIVRPA